ncbi:hypothetical protein Hanom_Chr11g01050621 [Helianthus anomalus]
MKPEGKLLMGFQKALTNTSMQIEKLNLVIKELVKEKNEEKERFIARLVAENEKDKVDKDDMLERMSQIDTLLTTTV